MSQVPTLLLSLSFSNLHSAGPQPQCDRPELPGPGWPHLPRLPSFRPGWNLCTPKGKKSTTRVSGKSRERGGGKRPRRSSSSSSSQVCQDLSWGVVAQSCLRWITASVPPPPKSLPPFSGWGGGGEVTSAPRLAPRPAAPTGEFLIRNPPPRTVAAAASEASSPRLAGLLQRLPLSFPLPGSPPHPGPPST